MTLNDEVMDDIVYTVVNDLLVYTYNIPEEIAGDIANAAAFAAKCRAVEISKQIGDQDARSTP